MIIKDGSISEFLFAGTVGAGAESVAVIDRHFIKRVKCVEPGVY